LVDVRIGSRRAIVEDGRDTRSGKCPDVGIVGFRKNGGAKRGRTPELVDPTAAVEGAVRIEPVFEDVVAVPPLTTTGFVK
jgi:hypothetical protein